MVSGKMQVVHIVSTKECSLEAYTANKGDVNGELK
jgi:hypothetical protein